MKVVKANTPFPAIMIDDFFSTESMLRAAANSFDNFSEQGWVKYAKEDNQIQICSKVPRKSTPECLLILDYIASNFDPSLFFEKKDCKVFPDTSHYGGGMMVTPNSNGEGGYLGMHVDALTHAINKNWKREYSAILCLSEEYDSSFDLMVHDGDKSHGRIPYKFNRLNVFKCSENSWHGLPEITKGMDRKTLGVMYWSVMTEEEKSTARVKAKFNDNLDFS